MNTYMCEINKRYIYLMRHAKPELSEKKHVCIGKKDIPLSQEGKEHAKKLAKYFLDKNIKNIYSSSLKRAASTAEIIADNKMNIIIRDNFSELDVGKWDGLSFDEIKNKYTTEYAQRGTDLENYVIQGGESMAMLRKRAISELQNAINESLGNILIVTHAGVIRTIISSIMEIAIDNTFDFKIDYGNISILALSDTVLSLDKVGIQELSNAVSCINQK